MKTRSYVLMALVILATSAPTLALAQYEKEGDGQPDTMILTIFSLTLYVTISAILGVVGYSIWKVFKIRRKAAKMRLA
jgi:heme/copper-type cytochrome/quinol oxidase subunit 2